MTIREIIDWVLEVRITWHSLKVIAICIGCIYLLVVLVAVLGVITEKLTQLQKTMVFVAGGLLIVLATILVDLGVI